MSDQAAQPAVAASAPDPSGGYDLHDCALKAQTALERLATELAHAGFDKSVTTAVTKMADASRKIVAATAKQAHQPPADAAPAAPPHHTMGSATDAMMSDLHAQRGA